MKDPHRDEATADFRALGVCDRNGTEPQTKEKQNADVEKETVEEQMPPEHKPPELSFAEKQTATIIRLCMDYCKWRSRSDMLCLQTEDEKVRAETRRVLHGICSTCPVHTLLDLDKDGAP